MAKRKVKPAPQTAPPRKRVPRVMARDEFEKQRIISIATSLVAGMFRDGSLDPKDDAAIERAIEEAVKLAAEVFRAAEDYVFG